MSWLVGFFGVCLVIAGFDKSTTFDTEHKWAVAVGLVLLLVGVLLHVFDPDD